MAVLNVRFAIIFSPSISSKSIHPRHTDRKVNSIQFNSLLSIANTIIFY
ncbi:hypothetical protein PB1A_0892 [Leuconostoc inhae]|uniref:Uncharacterized protein n=1 Tax=Leuconostoc inhae TaxID=178001 RepID=A0AAN2QSB5_9LACO|nr:hypothetical protein LEGAS_0090 [Leuconostoc gasicomitatum LMG 18811]CUW03833.1 hypothetical protein PL111_1769 [Leuconostoc inhae]CUW04577.1 hypothetical protein PB1A_0892 [Leuconostoc inhae]CUW18486.1 hypothetical protein C120C_1051 [Leuconostoc inhae]CUW20830.1 hypothetical protein KSL4_1921 [Leuconostoc inhae]